MSQQRDGGSNSRQKGQAMWPFGPNIKKLEANGNVGALVEVLTHKKRGVRARAAMALENMTKTMGAQKMKALLESEANVNARTKDGSPILMRAIEDGRTETVRLLLDAGADANAKTEGGHTVLMKASVEGHTEIVQYLIDAGADVNTGVGQTAATALRGAAFGGHVSVVRLLLDAGADVNAESKDKTTALMDATQYGHTAVVRLLIDALADEAAKYGYMMEQSLISTLWVGGPWGKRVNAARALGESIRRRTL